METSTTSGARTSPLQGRWNRRSNDASVFKKAAECCPSPSRLLDGVVLGMTTYMNIDPILPRMEIGSTWVRSSARGTGTNVDAKLLMLRQAFFDDWECPAIEFRTHWMNAQSRAAIERLGAKLDGILRSHTRTRNGALRDTCVYSITASEWPAVRAGLESRLARHLKDPDSSGHRVPG